MFAMPRGQDRQVNAQDKALETLSNLVSTPEEEETEPVTPTAQVVTLLQPEQVEETPKPRKKAPPVQQVEAQSDGEVSKKKGQTEDFFDYLQRITPSEWSNSQTSGLYVYKKSPKGNVRITDEPLHCPITLQELRDEYLPVHGDGTYRLQFTTGLKHLSNCGENVTFDASGNFLSTSPTGFLRQGSVDNNNMAVPEVMQAASRMLEHGARASVDVVKANQIENNKSVDIAGIITAIAALNNHKDGDSAMVKMLEAQKAEADKRADREKADADKRADRDKAEADARIAREITAANERQTRDQQFFQMIMKQNEDRAADKDKFFEILLKEKDKKEAGLGEMMSQFFKAFVADKLEGGSGSEILPGWAGVVQTALPKVADAVSTFMAVRAGATPQQVQALQTAQAQQNETAHGPNGGVLNPAPVSPLVSADQQLVDFINRLGNYVSSHENPDPGYMLTVINEEYGSIEDWIFRTPQDQILAMLQNNPLGQRLLAIPNAPPFIDQLILGIKNPEGVEEPEPAVIPATAQQYSVQEASSKPKKRKSAAN